MNDKTNLLLIPFALLTSLLSYSQDAEWLVEMNPNDGTFEAVGPSLSTVELIYVGYPSNCKDEVNGQYIFMKGNGPV